MNGPSDISERALVLAPRGRDSEVAGFVLRDAGFSFAIVGDLHQLCEQIAAGAGVAIVSDEAVHNADLRELSKTLSDQPPWSDFPIVLLTQRGGGPERNPAASRLAETLGNVTFLERPFHPTTLVSLMRTAIRGRRRQYEARAHLEELGVLTSSLEQRVKERTEELVKETEARERAQERLVQSQKMETIGQLTGGVAHDFNNLLSAIMGNLDLLKKLFRNDPKAQRLIDGALQGAQRGASLTQRMLAFARQQDLSTRSTDMAGLLDGMRDLLERTLGPQIALTIETAPGLPPAEVDPVQIELAVLNLAINSRDAMPNGGSIAIRLDKEAVAANNDGIECIRLSVTDNGTGMDEDTLRKAVDPFFSTKPVGKGTGLGLSMVHGVIVQLGGRFQLTSEPGRGTTATLILPASSSTPSANVAEISNGEQRYEGKATILLVDDDLLVAMSAASMLEDLGHTVIEANSAKRALEILERDDSVDLLMTDQAMPGMTGTQLAEIVRLSHPEIPILLATGYADLPDAAAASIPRLTKPYMLDQLKEQIDRLLAGAKGV